MEYGSSQARGQTGAAAAGLHHSHSHMGSELCLRPTLQQAQGRGPLELRLGTDMVFSFFFLFGLHLQHMESPRLGVESELHLLAYTTATATPDLSWVCNLHQSSWQSQILNPLSKARDQTHVLMDTSRVH